MTAAVASQLLVWIVSALVCASPLVAARRREPGEVAATLLSLALAAAALWSPRPDLGYAALALAALAHGVVAWPRTRTGAAGLLLSAGATGAAAVALWRGAPEVAFVASLVAIGLRAGCTPLHAGVSALVERAPGVQTRQLGTMLTLVYLHLRDVDHIPLALKLSTPLVCFGAVVSLVAALRSLVARDVASWLRGTIVMHAGLLACGLGAAGNGHFGAALLAAITLALALGGMGIVVASLRERCGVVALDDLGGRARALPRLTAAFAVFAGAGVGLPATAGFIADDLMLHALWAESRVSAGVVIVATAVLAISSLAAWSKVFLGPPRPSLANDLEPRERGALVVLLLVLLAIGLVPQVLMDPIDEVLGIAPADAPITSTGAR